jgi:lipopolysaccharide transport system ATP-binding protein
MPDIVIQANNLGKKYTIGHQAENGRYTALRDVLMQNARSLWHKTRDLMQGKPIVQGDTLEEVWALKDVSFEIRQGEVVGIIGRNGAGKSTLLKVLSRITEPSAGRVTIKGRVASLLEVGTGFHPELTGRENIYLNGAILGMSRAEIKRKFDEIVEFAEVEKFLDTPVKRYSSGMYVRLAFAVAAHLEPEILVVDEVLAVGDAQFQKKCLGKMSEVSHTGRTVLFVSHNMAAVEFLCDRCFLFDQGQLEFVGEPGLITARYLALDLDPSSGQTDLLSHPGRTKGSMPIMTKVVLASGLCEPISSLPMGSQLSIQVSFSSKLEPVYPILGVVLKNRSGGEIFGVNNRFIPGYEPAEPISEGMITCHFSYLPLMPGKYLVDLYFGDDHSDLDVIHQSISFDVTPADVFKSGKLPPASCGPIFWPATWSVKNGQACI